MSRSHCLPTLAALLMCFIPSFTFAEDFGDCTGDVEARWLPDGRTMELLADLRYVDSQDKLWKAEAGRKVNGASIPSALWSFIGSPFAGLYRNASVVHDVECDAKRESWQDVHAMFYEAMRCAGVGNVKARIMYAAVYHCGPRWGDNQGVRLLPCGEEGLKSYIRRFKHFFNVHKLIRIDAIASLELDSLDAIDGTSPIDRIRERGFEVIGKEDLEGFTIVLSDVDLNSKEGWFRNEQILAALAEELESPSNATILIEGLGDDREPDILEQVAANNRAREVEDTLVQLGIEIDRLQQISYGEEKPGVESFDSIQQKVSKAVVIRVVQIRESE